MLCVKCKPSKGLHGAARLATLSNIANFYIASEHCCFYTGTSGTILGKTNAGLRSKGLLSSVCEGRSLRRVQRRLPCSAPSTKWIIISIQRIQWMRTGMSLTRMFAPRFWLHQNTGFQPQQGKPTQLVCHSSRRGHILVPPLHFQRCD